ncbi:pleurocidin-like peptide WF4 [Limanda limanda]|uniref:pleurocidin-like peptide WF4 n=1 Tax=Limanda limanda TaxID=27771 RepID=UPI0029C8B0E9|nr:pleurocidin-like peptide WF4 [Limanda limanda]XP_060947859.1 pleurocidin-like peptide WF4 [Limanda limanda]XP_060947860.1 pleurocidin-like peptide WF4 [Limanda limanda]
MKFTATFLMLSIFVLMVDLGEGRFHFGRHRPHGHGSGHGRVSGHLFDLLGNAVQGVGEGAASAGVDAAVNAWGQDEQQELNKRSDDDSPSAIVFD